MKGERQLTGARGEYRVIGKLMERGLLVYTPVVDVEGIDCIVHNDKGRLIKVQIKTRTKGNEERRNFVVKRLNLHYDFFICCYFIDTDELWVVPSFKFSELSVKRSNGEEILVMNAKRRRELARYKDDLGLELFHLKSIK